MIESCEIATLTGLPVLQQVMDTRQSVDTVIVCSDGRLGAHRIVLAAASSFLAYCFEDQKLGEVAVVLLPDVKKSTMEILMHLAYTGQMFYPPEVQEEVYAAMDLLLFGQNASLDLRMVRVKMPKIPERTIPTATTKTSPIPSTSGTSEASSSTGSSNQQKADKRKRKLEDTTDNKKRRFKKPKLDEHGKQIHVAYRTGTAIGKTGAVRLRKKAEKKLLRDGMGICPAPSFESVNKSLSLPAWKWPLLSIRLKPIEDLVCVEVHKKIKSRWTESSATVQLQPHTTDSTTIAATNNNTIVKVVEAIHHYNVDAKSDKEEPSNHNTESKNDKEDQTMEIIPTSPTSISTTSPTPTSSCTSSTSSRREVLVGEEDDEEEKILCGMPTDKSVFYEKIAIN